jgi:hypothetical protein
MACPLVLKCRLGDTMCLDPKVSGVRNSDIILFFWLGIPFGVNKSQVYIKTVTLSTSIYQFYS